MITRHTPGPWLIPGSPDLVGTEGPNRRLIASLHGPEMEANARLIAAAPELLAAALAILAKESEMTTCHAYMEYRELETAIAKATGKDF